MKYFTLCRQLVMLAIIILLPFNSTFADGCDDLMVTINNNTGLTVKAYYTNNSLDVTPKINVISIPPYSKNFDLPRIINKGSLPQVFSDIIFKAESEQSWNGVDYKTNIDMPMHDDVISITKYYTSDDAVKTSVNFLATDCQRTQRLVFDNGHRRWMCKYDKIGTTAQNDNKNRELLYTEVFPSAHQNRFEVKAELNNYGLCAAAETAQPGKVIIHINPI